MDKKGRAGLILAATLLLVYAVAIAGKEVMASNDSEKPIIVCTTNVLGSIIKQYVDDQADVVVLAQPGLCPADYDMKPSDIYAVGKAEVLFHHGIQGEFWLDGLIKASENTNVPKIKISGPWNSPNGAKQYVRWIGGNLSQILGIDYNVTMNSMLSDIDTVSNDIQSEAKSLDVSSVKVICMEWQSAFVSWVGFNIVAKYGPPQMLSTADIQNLTQTAKKEHVALIIDNLQSGTDLGASLAYESNAIHVVLSNFPEAVPATETLADMLEYNARQLFDAVNIGRNTSELRSQVSDLQTQLTIFESITAIALVVVAVEAVLFYKKRVGK